SGGAFRASERVDADRGARGEGALRGRQPGGRARIADDARSRAGVPRPGRIGGDRSAVFLDNRTRVRYTARTFPATEDTSWKQPNELTKTSSSGWTSSIRTSRPDSESSSG